MSVEPQNALESKTVLVILSFMWPDKGVELVYLKEKGCLLGFHLQSLTSFPLPLSQHLPLGVPGHSLGSAPFFLLPKTLGLGVAHLECGSPEDFGSLVW